MDIADKLAPVEVLDPEGTPVMLGSFWKEKTAVVVFIRHFG